jgi:hypothetical protein
MLMGNIEGGALPDSLTHLTVRNVHNNRYVRWTLPNSLRFLRLNVGRTTPRDDFAAFVSRLPDSLEQLHLNQLTPIVTVAKWPAKLRELHVTMYVHVDRDTDSVTRVESSFEFAPLPATFESLHIGLTKHLEWNTSFRPRKNFKLNVYRFTDGQDSIMVDKLDGRTLELHRLLQ